ncbi:TolC family protein [Pseudomonas aeruginosa]|uniref:TolC family protein n=1 Tax=Pseudomonas aeruginosa TaxID=287 RepID=UPI000F5378CA|nr:TolC family protein [Pseudomonas aeruginosa]RPM31345.1 RND transporter [Pseudomonas aeruginosa]
MIHAQSIRSGLASALGLFSLLALSACTVGPDYRTPDTAAAKIDATASKPYDRSRFESLWWKQFDDPTLNQLVEQSLSGNRDLRVAFARLRAARALRDDVANDRFPVVTSRASADIGKGQQPGVTEDRVNSERYDLGLDSAWELDLFGRIRRQLESSDALSEAAEADLQQLQVSLIAELVDAYGQLRGAQLREKIALSNLENQKESRQLTEQLRDAGVGAELDVLRADARLAATAASVPQLQAEAERAWSVGPSISWAAFDLGSVRARLRGAKADADAALASYEQQVLLALEESANAFSDYGKRQERLVSLVRQSEASRAAAQQAAIRYREGTTDFLVLLDAEREQLSAEDAQAQAEVELYRGIVAIYRSLGGGWQPSA